MKKTLTYPEIGEKFEKIFKDLSRNLKDLTDEQKVSVLQSVADSLVTMNNPRYCLYFAKEFLVKHYNNLATRLDYSTFRETIGTITDINNKDIEYISSFCELTPNLEKQDNLMFETCLEKYNIYISHNYRDFLEFLNDYARKNDVKNPSNLAEFFLSLPKSCHFTTILLDADQLFKLANYLNEEDLEAVQKLIPADKMYSFVTFVDKKVNQDLAIEALIKDKNLWHISTLCQNDKLSSHEVLNKLLEHAASDEIFWTGFTTDEALRFRKTLYPADQLRLDESYISAVYVDDAIEYLKGFSELRQKQISLIKDKVYSMSTEDYYVNDIAETYVDFAKLMPESYTEIEERFVSIFDGKLPIDSRYNLVCAVDKMMQIKNINKDKIALLLPKIQTEDSELNNLLDRKGEFLSSHSDDLDSSTIEVLENDIFSNFTDSVVSFAFDYACDKDSAGLSTIKEQKYLLECLKVSEKYNLDRYEIYDNLWPFLDCEDCLKDDIQNALTGCDVLEIIFNAAQQKYADVQFFGKLVAATHNPEANEMFLEIEGCDRDTHLEQIAAYGDEDMKAKYGFSQDEFTGLRKIIANIPDIKR